MPPAALKIQGASNKIRWTLAKSTETTPTQQNFDVGVKENPEQEEEIRRVKMQVPQQHQGDRLYFQDEQQTHQMPRYSYDGSQYSSQSGRVSTQDQWRPPQGMSNVSSKYGADNYDGFDFNMVGSRDVSRASNRLSVNTGLRNAQQHVEQDAVSQHLLYETALMDSQAFEMLEIAEVDALKKEHVRLNQKIEATQRKLALESKVRDAAQNLQRLYSIGNKRPDTPQDSPDGSSKKGRGSLLGRGRTASSSSLEHAQQADNELVASVKKVDQLHHAIEELLDRRQFVERRLLRHTAAVLAEESNRNAESAVTGLTNGHHSRSYEDEDSAYTPNEFDGIRDILHGMPAGASSRAKEHEEQLASMQQRLEQLNHQLRDVISEASQTLGKPATAEVTLDDSEDSSMRVENCFARLEDSLYTLDQQQRDMKGHYSRIQEDQYMTKNAAEGQMHALNKQLHDVLLRASESQEMAVLQEPPEPSGHGYQGQLRYLEDSLMTMEQVLQEQQHAGATQKAAEQEATISELYQKLDEYETTMPGLKQRLADHESSMPELSRTLSEHEATITELSQKLHEHEMSNDELMQKLNEYEAVVPDLKQRLAEHDSTVPELSRKLSEHEATVSELLERLHEHETANRDLSQQLSEHETTNRDLLQQMSEHENTNRDLAQQLFEHQSTNRDLSQQLSEHEDVVPDLTQRLADYETMLPGLKQKLAEYESTTPELSRKLSQYEEQAPEISQRLAEHEANVAELSQKLSDYENTISGLWDLLQPLPPSRRPSTYDDDSDDSDNGPPTPLTPLKESFSLPAFSALIQNLYDRAQAAREQQDILRRQIQQQRDLNGKSDAEKDRDIAEWQDKHNGLAQERAGLQQEMGELQQELANWMVKHEASEGEAGQSRTELTNVMTELEEMRKAMDAKQAEREEVSKQMRARIEQMEAQLQAHAGTKQEMEKLEIEIVRLTVELTDARAALDGAYGNRQQRKGEQAAEVEALTDRNRNMAEQASQLERELTEMTMEFQELTKESIELEKEREQLDALIDGLRDRCDGLETMLSEEKLRWVGIKSPTSGGAVQAGVGAAREGTSMMVLRQEFKKMMRDQRAEGVRLLRAEQEERRRVEAELRKFRQANGPLGRRLESASGTATPV